MDDFNMLPPALLARAGIRQLAEQLARHENDLPGRYGVIAEPAQRDYINLVIAHMRTRRTLIKEDFLQILESTRLEMIATLLHCKDPEELNDWVNSLNEGIWHSEYVKFLKEYKIMGDKIDLKIGEYKRFKESIDEGFIRYMRREKGPEGEVQARREIGLLETSYQLQAVGARKEQMSQEFERCLERITQPYTGR